MESTYFNSEYIIPSIIIKSIITYECKVWIIKDRTERATEMEFWRRAARHSRREKIRNARIREIMR